MKKNYIVAIVLVVLVGGGLLIFGSSKKAEAPLLGTQTDTKVKDSAVSTVKEFTITGQNYSFTPSTITVKKGEKVKITFQNTDGFHNFVIDEFGVATSKAESPDTEVLEFIANKAGSFEYYCAVASHRAMGMKGTLKVE